VEDKPSRFWDRFWVVAPLVLGLAVGIVIAGQFPSTPAANCAQALTPPSTAANFALAVVLVALVVGRLVARQAIGPVAARAFTLAAFGLVVAACGTFFVTVGNKPCPPSGVASGHEAMVRIPHAQLHVSG
jgi:cytochrome bd-type quinol oxidase subunit 2